jgi:protocatechuate 3,4-dioxygenase beta subunit
MRQSQMQMFRCSFALILTLSASAWQASPPAGQPGTVRGQITSITGEPLRKADVTLQPTRGNQVPPSMSTTDAAGVFVFDNVTPGSYALTAQRTGYVRSEAMRRPGAPAALAVTIGAGQDVSGLVIKLTPHSVVTGKVFDEDGDPMYGANVNVLEERYFRGRRMLSPRANGTVNDLGEYRIAGLAPGRYFIAVEPRNEMGRVRGRVRRVQTESDTNFVTVYYPGVMEQSQATPIEIAAGQEMRGADVPMRKIPTVHLRGRVVDGSGNPVTNTAVMVMNGDEPAGGAVGRSMGVVRGADGAFDIPGIAPGNYLLIVNRMVRDAGRSTGTLRVQVGSQDVDGLVIRMADPAQVSGVIRADDNPDLRSIRVSLDPMESLPMDMHSSRNLAEGNVFTIPGVTHGKYRFDVVGAPDGYYLKSVQIAGQEVLESGIAVSGSVAGVEVILAKGAASVGGTITGAEGKPLSQGVVALVPPAGKRDHWRLFKTAMANQEGAYAFRNLPPGEYTLIAYSPGSDPTAVQNPEYLKQYESKGTVVKLAESASETEALKVVE